MPNHKITLPDIIEYLKGTASQPLMNRIEEKRLSDLQFDEEMIDWEAYISTSESKKEAVSRIRSLHDQWQKPIDFRAPVKEIRVPSYLPKSRLAYLEILLLSGVGLIFLSLGFIFLQILLNK